MRLFADDCLVYKTIKSEKDQLQLQEDLNKLENWADTWGMKFNPSKCYILSTSKKQDPPHHRFYTLCGVILEHHKDNPYLGVLLNSQLSFSNHINNMLNKANRTLGFISRNLKRCPNKLRETAYKSLVRPKLEYGSAIWDPYNQKDIDNIEKTQRKAARFVYKDYSSSTSVTSLLRDLKWTPLAERRRHQRLILMYKSINNMVKGVETRNILNKNTNRTRKGMSGTCYNEVRTTSEQYKNSFFPRTIRDWNHLPEDCRTSESLANFKAAIPPLQCY